MIEVKHLEKYYGSDGTVTNVFNHGISSILIPKRKSEDKNMLPKKRALFSLLRFANHEKAQMHNP